VLILDVSESGKVVQRLRGHDEEIHGVCWAPLPGEDMAMHNTEPDAGIRSGVKLEIPYMPERLSSLPNMVLLPET
jgi:hypothetical protein